MHPFVLLAYRAIKIYLESGRIISAPEPLPENMTAAEAVFISLHSSDDKLRGCRGTIAPTRPNLAEAIIYTAIASATDDPRFPPISPAEMEGLQIKVDVLSPLEPVSDIDSLDEKIYGVMVQSGERRAVLLPNIAAVHNVNHQLQLVRRKAGLAPDEPAQLYRFTVTRYPVDNKEGNLCRLV